MGISEDVCNNEPDFGIILLFCHKYFILSEHIQLITNTSWCLLWESLILRIRMLWRKTTQYKNDLVTLQYCDVYVTVIWGVANAIFLITTTF